jgi:CubicO group peptidase (beta-lactamase class C family)
VAVLKKCFPALFTFHFFRSRASARSRLWQVFVKHVYNHSKIRAEDFAMRDEITAFSASAADVGVDADKVASLLDRARREVDEGLLPCAQIALARHGKLIAFETFGEADNDSLFCIFSATKAITSAAAWLLIQDGKLNIDDRVVSVVPEFGGNDKGNITIDRLFTHTAGFPSAPFRPTDWFDKARRLQRFADWRLNWPVGEKFEYHPTSSMWVIAELIERLSGDTFDGFIRRRIAEPLGLPDLWVGLPDSEHPRVIDCSHTGDPMTAEDYARLGLPVPPVTEVTEDAILSFNTPEVRRVPIAGGGGIMSAAEIALFYQALITGRSAAGDVIWTTDTLDMARQVRTDGYVDPLSGIPVNRGLGIVIAGDERRNLRGFGHSNTASAFGHGGAGGQIAWGDPDTGISLGYCTSAHDRNPMRMGRRGISISNKAADCGTD